MVRRSFLKQIAIISSCLVMAACAGAGKARSVSPSEQYNKRVEQLSIKDELYSGWTNIFHYEATLITKDLYAQQVEFQSRAYQWSQEELIKSRRQMIESLGAETQIFISFFTPTIQYNDLNESGSIWRVYLEVDGKRYQASIQKNPASYPRLKSLYPGHSPWGKPYTAKFPIAFSQIEKAEKIRFVVTGNLGISEKQFTGFTSQNL